MVITYRTPTKIILSINSLASRNGKSFSDITDVVYMLKEDIYEADSSAAFNRSVKTGGVTLTSDTADVSVVLSDYGTNLIVSGMDYNICIGVEFNDSGIYIEDYDPDFNRKMKIIPDKIRM